MDARRATTTALDILSGPSYEKRREMETFELIAMTVVLVAGAVMIFILKTFFGWFPKTPQPLPLDANELEPEDKDEPKNPRYYDRNDDPGSFF